MLSLYIFLCVLHCIYIHIYVYIPGAVSLVKQPQREGGHSPNPAVCVRVSVAVLVPQAFVARTFVSPFVLLWHDVCDTVCYVHSGSLYKWFVPANRNLHMIVVKSLLYGMIYKRYKIFIDVKVKSLFSWYKHLLQFSVAECLNCSKDFFCGSIVCHKLRRCVGHRTYLWAQVA